MSETINYKDCYVRYKKEYEENKLNAESMFIFEMMLKRNQDLQSQVEELKEQLKLKTMNEVNASINADCLEGCRIRLKELRKSLK